MTTTTLVDLTTARAIGTTLDGDCGLRGPTLRWLLDYALAFNADQRDGEPIDLTACDPEEVLTIVEVTIEYVEANGYGDHLDENDRGGAIEDDYRAAHYLSFLRAFLTHLIGPREPKPEPVREPVHPHVKPGSIVRDSDHNLFAVDAVHPDTLDLHSVVTKRSYTNVPRTDVHPVPGITERL